jgi:integrase
MNSNLYSCTFEALPSQYKKLLMEGNQMTVTTKGMRLMPPYKKDKDGDVIPDGKVRKWYSNFRWKYEGEKKKIKIQVSLDSYEPQVMRAIENLGIVYGKLRQGVRLATLNRKIADLATEDQFTKDQLPKWKHIRAFFGDYRVSDLTPEIMGEYMEDRWGLNEDDELQVMKSTFHKEKLVFNQVVQPIDPNFHVSKLLEGIRFNEEVKEQLPPLTPEQIYKTTQYAEGHWGNIFFIMLYTGMEARDIYDLKPKHFIGDKIRKERHKTKFGRKKNWIDIPLVPELQEIFKKIPTPIDKNEPIFKNYEKTKVSKSIREIFTRAGLKGYGAKSIRRYMGEEINSQYHQEVDRVAKEALAHSATSKATKQYTRPRPSDLKTSLIRLVRNIEEAGKLRKIVPH